MKNYSRLIGGILLVSGTTIGAAMLALPVVTGFAGFWPSIGFLIFYWLFMTFTALLMLEVNLWMGEHTNLTTMAKKTLGKSGQILSCLIYLFLLYTLTTAYLAGSSPIFLKLFHQLSGLNLPEWVGLCPLLFVFGFFVYHGARSVDYVNRFLMIGLATSYLLVIIFVSPSIQPSLLERENWWAIWSSVSIVSTSFGFHIIIPTLTDYLHRDVKSIRYVIWIGSALPLLIYCTWELITLGIIPLEGQNGLIVGYQKGTDGASLLSVILKNPQLELLTRLFSLLAIITSFLGVSLSLRDFLADGLTIRKQYPKGKILLYLLTFLPPTLIALIDPRAFLNALNYAGAFGVVTLLGLFPALMVWRGRYAQHRKGIYQAPGGKIALGLTIVIAMSVILLEVTNRLGYLTYPS